MDQIHGLGAGVSMATSGAHAVAGGNWRIFKGMLDESEARVYLNTAVSCFDRGFESELMTRSRILRLSQVKMGPSSRSSPIRKYIPMGQNMMLCSSLLHGTSPPSPSLSRHISMSKSRKLLSYAVILVAS